jgi:hypothetical protein
MKFEKAFEAFAAFLETLSVAMTAANSINPVVNFFRCTKIQWPDKFYILFCSHTHGKCWEKTTSFILSNKSTFLA